MHWKFKIARTLNLAHRIQFGFEFHGRLFVVRMIHVPQSWIKIRMEVILLLLE